MQLCCSSMSAIWRTRSCRPSRRTGNGFVCTRRVNGTYTRSKIGAIIMFKPANKNVRASQGRSHLLPLEGWSANNSQQTYQRSPRVQTTSKSLPAPGTSAFGFAIPSSPTTTAAIPKPNLTAYKVTFRAWCHLEIAIAGGLEDEREYRP